jgi:hypothetical protein
MKVVSPYRPFEPESLAHQRLGPFDWEGALRMLAASVQRSCRCETYAISDIATPLGVPAHYYRTEQRRLMPWILEVSLQYLQSAQFDQDTVMISPDALVYQDLRHFFRGDLGLVIRYGEKYRRKPLLNGVQFWRYGAGPQLATFYREALELALTLPEGLLRWGADTEPIVRLLAPLDAGGYERCGLMVYGHKRETVMDELSESDIIRLGRGWRVPFPVCPIVDFKYLKKRHMAAYFDETVGVFA